MVSSSDEWYYIINDLQIGPVSRQELNENVRNGKINSHSMVWRPGLENWVKAGNLPEIFSPPPLMDGTSAISYDSSSREAGSKVQKSQSSALEKRKNYIIYHWQGLNSLAYAYWVNGVLLSIPINIIFLSLISYNQTVYNPDLALAQLALVFIVSGILVPWQLVGIWRSANRHTSYGGKLFWAVLAKLAVSLQTLRLIVDVSALAVSSTSALKVRFVDDGLPPATLQVMPDRREIYVDGMISRQLHADLKRIIADQANVRRIRLSSLGGRIDAAERISELVSSKKLEVIVDKSCFSACTIIFLAGASRFITENGRLGFHAPVGEGLSQAQLIDLASQQRHALVKRGISAEFAHQAVSTPSNSMWIPSKERLLKEGIIHQVVRHDSYLDNGTLAPFDYTSFAVEVLSKIKLYETIKRLDPRTYLKIRDRMAEAMFKGQEGGELTTELQALVRPIIRRSIPTAASGVISDVARLNLEYMKRLMSADPEMCVAFADPSKKGPTTAVNLTQFKDLAEREIELNNRVLETAGTQVGKALTEKELEKEYNLIIGNLEKRSDIDLKLVNKPVLTQAEYGPYCRLNIAFLEEALNLPEQSRNRFLRHLMSAGH